MVKRYPLRAQNKKFQIQQIRFEALSSCVREYILHEIAAQIRLSFIHLIKASCLKLGLGNYYRRIQGSPANFYIKAIVLPR